MGGEHLVKGRKWIRVWVVFQASWDFFALGWRNARTAR